MGLFKSVGNAVSGIGRTVTDTLGLSTPQSVTDAQGAYGTAVNEQLQKQREYQKKLSQEATKFREGLPGYKQEAANIAQDSGRRQLAKDLSSVDRQANRRGMLYSGIRQQSAADTLASHYSDQSEKRAAINQQSEDLARQMEEKALNFGIGVQQQQQAANDSAYNQALNQRMAQNQALSGLGGTVFGLLGRKVGS